MQPMTAFPADALRGSVAVPGDKSISHRALLLAASAVGETPIRGLLEADDVRATAAALRALGAEIVADGNGYQVFGRGVGGLAEADRVLDLGNSGTGVRLLIGLVASQPILSFFCGDASLSRRPMMRVTEPLGRMGAEIWARTGGRLPLCVRGAERPLPIDYRLPVASAQIKSAVLLAGLNAPGRTTVLEPLPTRDHSERLLRHFGAVVEVETLADGGRRITLDGQPELKARPVVVPGDVSSAAFPLVAALLVPGSAVTLTGVGANPLRTGLLSTLEDMGARLTRIGTTDVGGEPICDLRVEASALRGVDVPEARVPAMIDEFPILAVAAACAFGRTRMRGLGELRVKESDRLAAIAAGLEACGVGVSCGDDWLEIDGSGGPPPGGGVVTTHFDHRIAMSFLVLGLAARKPVHIDDGAAIATSFPSFPALMAELGAKIDGDFAS
ncbi:MAG TPA: 3-phosphoshikimate 1-carboxyvinyltransferase [Rhodospirillales bacterium]|nr:3-phosphoshikimate 1-carboxyvinyltransferase [Rhodospirillales bacterium]